MRQHTPLLLGLSFALLGLFSFVWSFFSLGSETGLIWWILNVYPHTCSSTNTQQSLSPSLLWDLTAVFELSNFLQLDSFSQGDISGSGSHFSSCGFLVSHLVFSGSHQAVLLGRFYSFLCSAAEPEGTNLLLLPSLFPRRIHRLLLSCHSPRVLPTYIPALLSNLPSFFSLSSQSVLSGFTSQISNMICVSNVLLWPCVRVNIWIGFLSPCDGLASTDGLMTPRAFC